MRYLLRGGGGANWSLTGVGRLGDLKQHRSRLQVSDFESREVDVVDVVLGFAQIVWMETKKRRVHRQTQTLARAMRQEYLVGGGGIIPSKLWSVWQRH